MNLLNSDISETLYEYVVKLPIIDYHNHLSILDIKTDPRGEEYRDLDWSKEYDLARNGDPNDTQTAL